MNRFLILANNGSQYYRDPRWPKYNVVFLSWFLSFTEYSVASVLDQSKNVFIEQIDDYISNISPNDTIFIYMSGIGGKRNGKNVFLPYEYLNIDKGLIDISSILLKFQENPIILFLDVYSPRMSFQVFDFTDCSIENCYISYNCLREQGPVDDVTVFTGRLIRSIFGHEGSTLTNVLDSFQAAMSPDRKTKRTKACAYNSLHASQKHLFLQGVLNNPDYQSQKNKPANFEWVYNMWKKLKEK